MNIENAFHYKRAIQLTPDTMRKLEQLILQYYASPSYKAKLLNGSTISFDSLDELLSYENQTKKRIVEISLFAALGCDSTALRLTIGSGFSFLFAYSHTINASYTVREEKYVITFEAQLKDLLDQVKAPTLYYMESKFSFAIVYISLFFVMVLLWAVLFLINPQSAGASPSFWSQPIFITGIIIGVIVAIASSFVDRWLHRLFPPIVFIWGNEVNRIKRLAMLRQQIFWGVIVAGTVSFISAKLF